MLDIRWIRSNADEVRQFLADRNNDMDIGPLLGLDEERRLLLTETEELKARRNEGSRKVGAARARGRAAARGVRSLSHGPRTRPGSRAWSRLCGSYAYAACSGPGCDRR